MHRPRTILRLGILLVIATAVVAPPAHADLYSAVRDYKKADYAHAFQELLALAELGQPQAQFIVAAMYHDGQGTAWSNIHAYAWATLAAANGDGDGKALADKIRPMLAPGSERIAGWLALPYTRAALERTLLPDLAGAPAQAPLGWHSGSAAGQKLKTVKAYLAPYPTGARRGGIQGWVFVETTVMPDGHTRFPRIVYADPTGVFEDTVKASVIRTQFARAPEGASPIRTLIPYHFSLTPPDWVSGGARSGVPIKLVTDAKAGNLEAQLLFGLRLDPAFGSGGGLPWLLKAAQAGLATAQYEIGSDLRSGDGCRKDEAKALKWLQMAADQGEPNAEITLAGQLLHGTPNAAEVTRAIALLERSAGQGTEEGDRDVRLLLAAILAATPHAALRDPRQALELLSKVDNSYGNPAPFEIRAAAQAAEGDFVDATHSERAALSHARRLGWELSPLEQRLALYTARKPWYGNLLDF